MAEYSCQLMQEEDLDEVIDLVQKAGLFPWSPRKIQDSFLSPNDTSFVLCTASGRRLLGYAVVQTILDESHLLNIVIAKANQSRGLGAYFLQELIAFVQQQHQNAFFLEVRASNKIAMSLYEKKGFTRTGVRKGYYPATNGREDAWLYSLSLV